MLTVRNKIVMKQPNINILYSFANFLNNSANIIISKFVVQIADFVWTFCFKLVLHFYSNNYMM